MVPHWAAVVPAVGTGQVCPGVLLQPDLAVILGVVTLAMLFVAGTRTSYILIAVLAAAPVGWRFFITGTPFRMRRMLAFLVGRCALPVPAVAGTTFQSQ